MKKESSIPVNQLIDEVTRTNKFTPVESDSTGLSPDLTDEDIKDIIERCDETED